MSQKEHKFSDCINFKMLGEKCFLFLFQTKKKRA